MKNPHWNTPPTGAYKETAKNSTISCEYWKSEKDLKSRTPLDGCARQYFVWSDLQKILWEREKNDWALELRYK